MNGSSRHAAIRPLDRLFALHAIGKAGSEPRSPARRSSAVEGVAKVASPHCFQVAKQPSGPCSKTPRGRSTGPDTCGGGRAGPAGLSSTSPCQSWQQICAPRHSYVSLGGQPPPVVTPHTKQSDPAEGSNFPSQRLWLGVLRWIADTSKPL